MAGPLLQIRHSYPVPNWNPWAKSVRGTTSHSKGEDCQALTHSTWTTENEAQLLVGLFGYLRSHSPHVWFLMASITSITSITIRLLQRPLFSVGPQPRGRTWGPPPGLSGYPSLGALWSSFAVWVTALSNISVHQVQSVAEGHYHRSQTDTLWSFGPIICQSAERYASFVRKLLVYDWALVSEYMTYGCEIILQPEIPMKVMNTLTFAL